MLLDSTLVYKIKEIICIEWMFNRKAIILFAFYSETTDPICIKPETTKLIILPSLSITNKNKKGEVGSPCLRPHWEAKKPCGDPFISTQRT